MLGAFAGLTGPAGAGVVDSGISWRDVVLWTWGIVMADKKKAYRRFEELTKRAMGGPGADAGPGQAQPDGPPDLGSAGEDAVAEQELTIWLSPEVRRALLERAATKNTTASRIVEEVLRRQFRLWS